MKVFESEPYCYPQNILGDEHKQFGMGRNAWLSGTASWTYVAGTQYILGIRPTIEGLIVDPCIPKDWSGFTAIRKFRGATYQINVHNPNNRSKGVTELRLNGKKVKGSLIPIQSEGTHTVTVTL
jgi:cellobiose phosphorylase